MYDGKQVVRVVNSYKKDDLYNIGKEMSDRKGTGNYEETRTEYNVEYFHINLINFYGNIQKKEGNREALIKIRLIDPLQMAVFCYN